MSDFMFRFCGLLVGLILVGCIMCLPLYKWKIRPFIASSLFTKIIWWVPIFIVLVAILYGGLTVAILVTLFIAFMASVEYIRNRGHKSYVASSYFALFLFLMAHLALWFVYLPGSATLLAAVCVVTVLSDVTAFFFGNYIGIHKLPRWINDHKSWEGVIGQIIGAVIGALLAWWVLQTALPILVTAVIGLASAFGDIVNSIAKRSLRIKDWGQTIPGHGGMLDRMSSLSAALAVSVWILAGLVF